MTTFDDAQKRYDEICSRLEKYENNKIALRKNALTELYETKQKLYKTMVKSCPHDTVEIRYGSYTDVGYGLDRHYYHYDLYCIRCNTYLLCKTDGDSKPVTRNMPLIDAVNEYTKRESLSDDELRKLNVKKSIHSVVKYYV